MTSSTAQRVVVTDERATRGAAPLGRTSVHVRPRTARERAMYRRRRLAAAGLGLVLIGALVLGVQGVRALVSGLTARSAVDTVTVPVTATTPVRLDLGSGGLDLPIYGAGLDEDGEIDPPQGAVMWYAGHGRVAPGELGTSVVTGRVSYQGEPDTFSDLPSVREGDRVTMTLGNGDTVAADIVSTHVMSTEELQGSDVVWGDQQTERRMVLVTSDATTVPGHDGDSEGHVVAVAEVSSAQPSADTPGETVPKG